jgi:hypothetical protein
MAIYSLTANARSPFHAEPAHAKTKSAKVLQIIDVEKPVPKDHEVLIKTCAASVNPLDWRLKSRRPGVDIAGEVVAVGEAAVDLGVPGRGGGLGVAGVLEGLRDEDALGRGALGRAICRSGRPRRCGAAVPDR